MTAINAGGAGTFLEFLCDVNWATNRLHQLVKGNAKCHEEACPQNGGKKELSRILAEKIQYGRLLVRTDQSFPHERSLVTHNVAFTSERNLTTNSEQKVTVRSWKAG